MIRRINQPGGAVYRPGELIVRRGSGEPPDPGDALEPYYASGAIPVHLDTSQAGEAGTLTSWPNRGAAGGTGESAGVAFDGALWWTPVNGVWFLLPQPVDLATSWIGYAARFGSDTNRGGRLLGVGDGVTFVNASPSGSLVLLGFSFSGTGTNRVTAPLLGVPAVLSQQVEAASRVVGWIDNSGVASSAAFTEFVIDRVGGDEGANAMIGDLGDVIVVDRTAEDGAEAIEAAKAFLYAKYSITPAVPIPVPLPFPIGDEEGEP